MIHGMDPITLRALAALVGLSHQRVSQLMRTDPKFPEAQKIGPSWVVDRAEAMRYFEQRKSGRGD
jgi:predicted DNA-binding transcriptional regulator AlpA